MKPLERLMALRDKEERLVLGLSSGTSADGVDAVLVRIRGSGTAIRVEVVRGRTYPYPPALHTSVRELRTVADVCRVNFDVGEYFAECAKNLIAEAGLTAEQVDLIGSHGQTVWHIPSGPATAPATLQIGEPDVIAERTRIPVVADFRTRDVGAGGDGAPLVPYVDFVLFRERGSPLALQNIGGISNVTLVRRDLEDLIAFDTGPGNAPLDELARVLSCGREHCDLGGRHAARGRIDEEFLERLLAHPYFARRPPKSTGREAFGREFVMEVLGQKGNLSVLDVLATMTLLVATSIRRAYEDFVFPESPVREVLVSGGGVHNLTLMAHLRRLFSPVPVWSAAERGLDPDLKEAVAFAVLANETIFGNPNNVPAATGAKWPVVLGKICP
jgi:anhydro-N-acetylmuramic acid kinase